MVMKPNAVNHVFISDYCIHAIKHPPQFNIFLFSTQHIFIVYKNILNSIMLYDPSGNANFIMSPMFQIYCTFSYTRSSTSTVIMN